MTSTTTKSESEEPMYSIDELIHKLTDKASSTSATVQAAFELRSMSQKIKKLEREVELLKSTEKIDWYSNKYVKKAERGTRKNNLTVAIN